MRAHGPIWKTSLLLVLASPLVTSVDRLHGQTPERAEEVGEQWLGEFNAHFNRHDARGAAAAYTTDAGHRVSSGTLLQGRTAIEEYLAELFERNPEARQEQSLTSARSSGTDLMLVESTWEITGLPEGARASGLATYILRRQGETWLCIAGRSMVPTSRR